MDVGMKILMFVLFVLLPVAILIVGGYFLFIAIRWLWKWGWFLINSSFQKKEN